MHKRSASPSSPEKSQATKELAICRFADARSAELTHFEAALENKQRDANRTPMQTVAKHMRRRAMSHNRFRVPSRIRALNGRFMKDNEKHILACRKHARNSKLILLHYFKRSLRPGQAPAFTRHKWLETHLWHARRMAMAVYHGYKIADRCRQKAFRVSAAFSQHNCVVYDKSYYCLLRVEGPKALELRLLSAEIVRGKEKACQVANMGRDIGEVTFLKCSADAFLIIADPCLQTLISERLASVAKTAGLEVTITDESDSLNVFELLGQRATQVIHRTIKSLAVDPADRLLKCLEGAGTPTAVYFPTLYSYSLTCQHPRSRIVSEPIPPRPLALAPLPPPPAFNLPLFLNDLPDDGTSVEDFFSHLPPMQAAGYMGRFIESRRSQYSHKRNKKNHETDCADSQPLEKIPEPPKVDAMDVEPLADHFTEEETTKMFEAIKNLEFGRFPLLIVNTSIRQSSISRLLILAPNGFGKRLWRKLTVAGGKAVGRVEYQHVYHQLAMPVFPKDFPESAAFQQSEASLNLLEQDKYFRKPPAKRPNYLKLGSPWPFSPSLGELGSIHSDFAATFAKVKLVSLFGGVPVDNAYICYPAEADVTALLREFDAQSSTEQRILDQDPTLLTAGPTIKDELNPYSDRDAYVAAVNDYALADEQRPVIGRLTSGFLLYEKARGFGFGAVLRGELARLETIAAHMRTLRSCAHLRLPAEGAVALFRNPASSAYRYCLVTRY
jgi:ribonuclease P/MRP protein subunit POP1